MNTLELRDLHVTYRSERGDIPAVRGVNLTIGPGETVGLAGESGCGKSTIANAVLRLLPPTDERRGEVLLGGEDVYAMTPRTAARRALDVGGDRLSGSAARPQPRATGRRPDRRGGPPAHRPRQGRGATPDDRPARARRSGADAGELVSPSAVRWATAAGAHRPRPRLRATAADRRRADHRARRDGPGPGACICSPICSATRGWRCCSSPTTSHC